MLVNMKKKQFILIAAALMVMCIQGCGAEETVSDVETAQESEIKEEFIEMEVEQEVTESETLEAGESDDGEQQDEDNAIEEAAEPENSIPEEYQEAINGIFAYLADPVLDTVTNLRITSVKTEFSPVEEAFKQAIVAALENAGYTVELVDNKVNEERFDGAIYSYTSYNITGEGIYRGTIGLSDLPEVKEVSCIVYLEEFE